MTHKESIITKVYQTSYLILTVMKWISKNENKMKWNKVQNHIENTSTLYFLLLNQWMRVQIMYGPNIICLENHFSTRYLI